MVEQYGDKIFEHILNEKATSRELLEDIKVGTQWYEFGVLLKLNVIELDAIERMNGAPDFKAFKMLELWLSTNPNATRRELIETLQKKAIGESSVAEEYIKALKESE